MLNRLFGVGMVTLLLAAVGVVTAPQAQAAALPSFPMVLPVGWGETVQAGGTHTHASGVRSSIDLGASGGRSVDVVAAADGTIIDLLPNCQVILQHQDGWQTRYYHLKSIPSGLAVGQSVTAGTKLGLTGMPGRETCGRGTFRHVHFTLQKDNVEMPISGLSLGGYTVTASGGAYCGYWTRNSDGAIVADARRSCYAVPAVSNTLLHPSDLQVAQAATRDAGTSRSDARPAIAAADTIDSAAMYVTEGEHTVGGRAWRTTCEPYSQTERCRTEIWASTVQDKGGVKQVVDGWAFNNLTYVESSRSLWAGNPLGSRGEWTAEDGRKWKTECDNAATGANGCRSYTLTTFLKATPTSSGTKYETVTDWVFNNMVRFN